MRVFLSTLLTLLFLSWGEVCAVGDTIAVRQNLEKPWKIGDEICSLAIDKRKHCGTVLKVGKKALLIREWVPVRQNTEKPWKVGDQICSTGRDSRTYCGVVVKVGQRAVLIRENAKTQGVEIVETEKKRPPTKKKAAKLARMVAPSRKPELELSAPVAAPAPARLLAPPPVAAAPEAPTPVKRNITAEIMARTAPSREAGIDVGGGMTAGLNFYFPMFHFQQTLTTRLSAGVMPFYNRRSADTTAVSVAGAYLTSTYHLGPRAVSGFVARAGLGYYAISVLDQGEEVSGSSLALSTVGGYRFLASPSFVILGAVGGQMAVRLSGDRARVDFSGAMPLFSVEAAYSF